MHSAQLINAININDIDFSIIYLNHLNYFIKAHLFAECPDVPIRYHP